MSRYDYHANAVGFGGVLTSANNSRTVIPSLASVALSPAGGEAYAVAENYCANGFAFSRAESRVVGAEVGSSIFTTFAEVFITNFTAFDAFNIPRLRIAMMGAQVISTRNLSSQESEFKVRARFDGINVDGVDLDAEIDGRLCDAPTIDDVVEALRGDAGESEQEVLNLALTNPNVQLTGSLVKGWSLPEVAQRGGKLPIPRLGTAHFGEFRFDRGRRRVNLVRLELGHNSLFFAAPGAVALEEGGGGGNVIGGSVEGNGSPPF